MNNNINELMPLENDQMLSTNSAAINKCLLEIQSNYNDGTVAKIPFTEIASLGASFSALGEIFQASATEPLYRCVFPKV